MPTSNTLPIATVVNISIANPPAGLSNYKVNNILYATKEAPQVSLPDDFTIYLDPIQVGRDWGLSSEVYQAALNIFAQQPNILGPGGAFIVAPMANDDTLTTIYNLIAPQIYFGGMLFGGYQPDETEMTAAAAVFQAAGQILFLSSNDPTLLTAGHAFFEVQAASQSYARCLLYTVSAIQARLFAAAYASRAMSTDFTGTNTTQTLQLKDLANVLPDPGITSTVLATCETIGVDVFTTIGPLPKVFSTGGNTYFDQVFGTLWLAGALQVAGFNALATTPTKLPQTEQGVAYLRNSYTAILEQGVNNAFLAPGAWNSPVTFGDPTTLRKSVENVGYFVYSLPVNKQSQADRVDRKAPLIQIAAKLAGAIHSSSVIVYINP